MIQLLTALIQGMPVPIVKLQTAIVLTGTVTATLAPTHPIAPAMKGTLETTVRWMNVSYITNSSQ